MKNKKILDPISKLSQSQNIDEREKMEVILFDIRPSSEEIMRTEIEFIDCTILFEYHKGYEEGKGGYLGGSFVTIYKVRYTEKHTETKYIENIHTELDTLEELEIFSKNYILNNFNLIVQEDHQDIIKINLASEYVNKQV